MKVKVMIVIFFLLLISSLVLSEQKLTERDLAKKYGDFLKLTQYIILP